MCSLMSPVLLVSCAILSLAVSEVTNLRDIMFSTPRKASNGRVTLLNRVLDVSLLKCCVECSQVPGCLALEYRHAQKLCNMYRQFRTRDGRQARVNHASDASYFIRNGAGAGQIPTRSSAAMNSTGRLCGARPSFVARGVRGTFIGCYNDSTFDRVLPNIYRRPPMTNVKCMLGCHRFPRLYFGTESGRFCYCGDELKKWHKKQVSNCRCSMRCRGDRGTLCGGDWVISVYKISA